MRVLILACIASLAWSTSVAAEVVADVTTPPVVEASTEPSLPDDIRVTAHPKVRESVAGHESLLLKYRPSENLPEVTNEDLLQGYGDKDAVARLKKSTVKVGTLPRLKLLPCDVGCDTDDYRKAEQLFLAKYDKAVANGHFTYRGTMTAKVRWYKVKSYLARKLSVPVSDVFAISFPLEGKLYTLSTWQMGKDYDVESLTTKAAARLFLMMFNQVGLGLKPTALQRLLPETERNVLTRFSDATAGASLAFDSLLGQEDTRSRLEPMTEADNVLLPAFDGILPNEVDPLTEPVIFNDI